LIDVQKIADVCTDKWYNQTLCKVNDAVVRMAVVQGEYHWHDHNDIDEFFFVLDGKFFIDLEDRVIDLSPRQGFVVPKGVRHRTRAPERTVILMVERADIVPTGDWSWAGCRWSETAATVKTLKIISGGQTGVDRAALDVALAHGIDCGGWCPAGRLDEIGKIPDRYPLQELPAGSFTER